MLFSLNDYLVIHYLVWLWVALPLIKQRSAGQGIGKVLLAQALKQVSKVAQIIGVNFVVIHAKDQKAIEFYQRFGFISLTSNPLTLIYPVNEIPNFK